MASTLRLARGIKSGDWAELQVAGPNDDAGQKDFEHWKDDSRFLSLEALRVLHGAFARALPGFDLFVPRLFAGEALTRLARELDAAAIDLVAVTSAAAAREKWGAQSELVRGLQGDAEWRAVRDTLSEAAHDVAAFAREASGKGRGLWVLAV